MHIVWLVRQHYKAAMWNRILSKTHMHIVWLVRHNDNAAMCLHKEELVRLSILNEVVLADRTITPLSRVSDVD